MDQFPSAELDHFPSAVDNHQWGGASAAAAASPAARPSPSPESAPTTERSGSQSASSVSSSSKMPSGTNTGPSTRSRRDQARSPSSQPQRILVLRELGDARLRVARLKLLARQRAVAAAGQHRDAVCVAGDLERGGFRARDRVEQVLDGWQGALAGERALWRSESRTSAARERGNYKTLRDMVRHIRIGIPIHVTALGCSQRTAGRHCVSPPRATQTAS